MLKRLKRIWRLSKIEGIEDADDITITRKGRVFKMITSASSLRKGDAVREVSSEELIDMILGDGQAEFLSDMTDQEVEDYQHEEIHGWKKLRDRLHL